MSKRSIPRFFLVIGMAALFAAVFASSAAAITTIKTGPATEIDSDEAVLTATLSTGGQTTAYAFEYGTTTKYGQESEVKETKGGGIVKLRVKGLQPHTVYHFRAVAFNFLEGEKKGLDETFETQPRHAPSLSASEYPVEVAGTQDPADPHVLTYAGRTFSCVGVATDSKLGAASSSIALQAQYTNCSAVVLGNTLSAEVKMNSCSYVLNVANAGPPYSGSLNVTCSKEGDAIEAIALSGGTPACVYKIAPQSGLKTIGLSNTGQGSVSADFDLKVAATRALGTLATCGGPSVTATYGGTSILQGEDGEGSPIDVYMSGEPSLGLEVVGKESGEKESQPRLDADAYPADVAGTQDPADPHVLTYAGRTFSCDGVYTDGELLAASSSIALQAQYTNCDAVVLGNLLPAEVKMNSCSYVLNVANAGPPYSGSLNVTCSKEGDAIEAIALSGGTQVCVYKIAPQSGLKTIGLSNSAAGVLVDFSLGSIATTRSSGTLASCGGPSGNATYGGTSVLQAF